MSNFYNSMGFGRALEGGGASCRPRQMVRQWPCMVPLDHHDTSVLTLDAMCIIAASDGTGSDDGGELEGHFCQVFCLSVATMQLNNANVPLLNEIYG